MKPGQVTTSSIPPREIQSGGGLQPSTLRSSVPDAGGPNFAEVLKNRPAAEAGLAKALDTQVPGAAGLDSGIKFSNHAIDRMMSRGIHFSKEDLSKLGEAVSKAQAKGSKDSLILMNDSALIVSVKNKTVVTVMDKAALKENVFTNIDSTIVM